jgi:proteasome alpha subunit
MIEEPYRWVEAISNRREYIETQLASGSPIVAVSCAEGILFVTVGRGRQKIFEIYDRIAMGAIGHPGDIERLRMAAIELASTEGFTRSAADVSLRRLAFYSLSPVMKSAFEQVYGAPFLARLLFAEVGATEESDLFLRVEYDGTIFTNAAQSSAQREGFAAIAGNRESSEAMERHLRTAHKSRPSLSAALNAAINAWIVAHLASADSETKDNPTPEQISAARAERLGAGGIEAALLERNAARSIRYRTLTEAEIESASGR